jgi:RNA polymerase sigma-70 factor (ECF subfamily)
MSGMTDDAQLLGSAARGDRGAFEAFMQRHYGNVVAYLRRGTGDAHLAEDLAQETFLRAYRKSGSFRGAGSAAGWIYAIATNLLTDHRRRRRPAPIPGADLAPERDDSEAVLRASLATLDESDARLLWLKFVDGLSFAEAAEALGEPATTLKYRAARALDRLARALKDRGFPLDGSHHDVRGISSRGVDVAGR